MNNAAVHMGVQVSLQDFAFNLFEIPEVGLLDHMVILFLNFEELPYHFFSSSSSWHSHQQCASLPRLCEHLLVFIFLDNSIYPDGCERHYVFT